MSVREPPDQVPEVVDLSGLFEQLWKGRWRLTSASLLGAALAAVVAFATTPIYRATTVLIPVRADRSGLELPMTMLAGSLGGLADFSGLARGAGQQRVDEALAVLRSRQFTERFIREQGLLPTLIRRYSWLWWAGTEPTAARAVRVFNEKVRVVIQDPRTTLVTIHMDWDDPVRAADLADAQVDLLNAEMRSRALYEIDAALSRLQEELDRSAVLETRNAINRLVQAQINRRLLARATPEYVFRRISPAIEPDRTEDRIRPRTPYLVGAGALAGAAIGALAVLYRAGRELWPKA